MRILALDIGTKTIGVAVSDDMGITANGVTTIRRKDERSDLAELGRIVEQYSPSEIVVGVPYNEDGSLGKRAKAIAAFAGKVEKEFSVPVTHWDESFSTARAESRLLEADMSRQKRRKVIDKMAAVIILQEYLASR